MEDIMADHHVNNGEQEENDGDLEHIMEERVDAEPQSPQEHLDLARRVLQETLQDDKAPGNFRLDPYDIVALVLDAGLKDACLKFLSDRAIDKVLIDFEGMAHALESLGQDNIISTPHATMGIGMIAGALGRIYSLKELGMEDFVSSDLVTVAVFIHSCRQVTTLYLRFMEGRDDDVELEANHGSMHVLTASLDKHPSIENLEIIQPRRCALRAIGAASMPKLEKLILCDTNIFLPEDANAIRNIVSLPKMNILFLCEVSLGNADVTKIIVDAIAASTVTDFEARNLTIPFGCDLSFVDMLAGLIDVTLNGLPSDSLDRLVKTLSSRLQGASRVQSLVLGDSPVTYGLKDDLLVSFLNKSRGCKLPDISVCVDQWSERFEKALSRFIEASPCLSALHVYVNHPRKDRIALNGLVDAVDSGTRCLERLTVLPESAFDSTRVSKVCFLTDLNRKRRLAAPIFASICDSRDAHQCSDRFRQALNEVGDTGSIFEFIRRGEMGLLSILKRAKPEKRLSGRKRSIESMN